MTGMSGKEIISALEDAWRFIQARHTDLPDVVLVTGRRRHKSEISTLGATCKNTWQNSRKKTEDGKAAEMTEVIIYGERLADGGLAVMQTLLHEAAHCLAIARGITDTSNRGRYHNKKFAALAAELGLTPPEKSGGPHFGYSDCRLILSSTRSEYDAEIADIGKACELYAIAKTEPVKTRQKPRKARCECPDASEISWTRQMQKRAAVLGEGVTGLICGICRQPFEIADEEE